MKSIHLTTAIACTPCSTCIVRLVRYALVRHTFRS